MLRVNKWLISAGEVIEGTTLSITFTKSWFQDDLEEIRQQVFLTISEVTKIENILGADRENTRFIWKNQYFTLNFEYYSQSCWIEVEGTANSKVLNTLQQILTQTADKR